LPTSGYSGNVGTTVSYPVNIANLSDGTHTGLAAADLSVTYPKGVFGIPVGSAATADVSFGSLLTGGSTNWVLSANSPLDGVLNIQFVAEPGDAITSTTGGTLVMINFPVVANPASATSETINVVPASGSFDTQVIGINGSYTASSLGVPASGDITVKPTTNLNVSGSLPAGTVNTSYSATLTASGGTGPYTFAVTSGTLPPGLSLNSTGILGGIPTTLVGEPFTFTVTANDLTGHMGNQTYSVTINPAGYVAPGNIPSLSGNTVFLAGTYTITGMGGVFTIPAGVTLTIGPDVNLVLATNVTLQD
jgi:hypothetical protein